VTISGVERLLADRVLARYPDAARPILCHHVQRLLDSGWRPPINPAHEGRVPTGEARKILGLSRDRVLERARLGRVPAVKDARGAWWFRSEQLEAIARARRCESAGALIAEPSGSVQPSR
jgi:hypothetical protein